MTSLALSAMLSLALSLGAAPKVPQPTAASSRTIPSNVMAALTAKFPQAKIDKWTREKEDGKEVYDIEFKQADKKFEADIFADGTIHNWEQQIAASDLPQPVVQAVSRQFPKAAMKEIMAVTAVTNGNEHLEGYEIVVQRTHKKDIEMTIAPDGKILEGPKKP
jgi:Putative beta-lactamase-inhibitor-like, PepSY-like